MSTKAELGEHCREACQDTQTSISHLVQHGGHELKYPKQRELNALTKSGKTLGVRPFYIVRILVERPDPRGLSTFLVSAQSSCRTGDSNSCPPDLELGTLTKLLAS